MKGFKMNLSQIIDDPSKILLFCGLGRIEVV